MSFLMIFVPFVLLCILIYRKCGEVFALTLFTVLFLLAGLCWLKLNFEKRATHRNMDVCLRKAAEMLKAGENDTLRQTLQDFMASDAYKQRNPLRMSTELRKAMDIDVDMESVYSDIMSSKMVPVVVVAWAVCVAVWDILRLCKINLRWRKIYLVTLSGMSAFVMFCGGLAVMVRYAYVRGGIKFDLEYIVKELDKPQVRPEFVEILENPLQNSYYHLQRLPKDEPSHYIP